MTRVIVLTGASAGVGRATAVAFARTGARVALIARSERGLAAAGAEVESAGGTALLIPADVADFATVEDAAKHIELELGPIDVWVNNAMATVFARFAEIDPAEFRRATDVTYLGYVWGTLAALRRMIPRNRGTIIQVGSTLAYRGIPLQTPYCGAKHAIQGFTEALRCELIHDHVDVHLTMVQLPALNTPQFNWARSRMPNRPQPVPPIYDPEIAARAVVWAAANTRRELYVGGPTVLGIVGNRVAPWLGDLYLARTGFRSQQTDERADPAAPDNLFDPVDELHSTRGRFTEGSRCRSLQLELTLRRDWLLTVAGAIAAVAGFAALKR